MVGRTVVSPGPDPAGRRTFILLDSAKQHTGASRAAGHSYDLCVIRTTAHAHQLDRVGRMAGLDHPVGLHRLCSQTPQTAAFQDSRARR